MCHTTRQQRRRRVPEPTTERCTSTCARIGAPGAPDRRPGLCAWCSAKTREALGELPDLWEKLHDQADMEPWSRIHTTRGRVYDPDSRTWTTRDITLRSIDTPLISGPLLPSQATGDKVTGSRERSLGAVRLDVL